ncbi:MAG: hypothetical protein ACYC8T_35090 [Myxococcaceae bacterium]
MLAACGPSGAPLGGGKKGAAQALFHALRPASAEPGAAGSSGQGIDVTSQSEVKGRAGGTATVVFDVSVAQSGAAGGVTVRRNIKFVDFSDDGKTRYNGSLVVDLVVQSTGTSALVKYAAKGRVDLSGEVSDFLDADVTLEVSTSALSASSGTAGVKLAGTVTTGAGAHAYSNEAFEFDVAEGLPAQPLP